MRETGLDNSTLLAPIGDADYVLVNHARWDKGPLRLAAEQLTKLFPKHRVNPGRPGSPQPKGVS